MIGLIINNLIFSIIKKKTKFIIVPVILLGMSSLSCSNSDNLAKGNKYKTCEICGYIAFNNEEGICEVCSEESWEDANEFNEYKSKKEWLIEEQIDVFFIDSINQQVDFTLPYEEAKSFRKDTAWKPAITKEDLVQAFLKENANN